MINLLWVALGGAIGASARYGVTVMLANATKAFPFATLTVNIVGSFVLALLFCWQVQQESSNSQIWLLLGVGVLGAFTTFSTFALDGVLLVQQGAWLKAALNILLNVIGCMAAVGPAMWIMKP